MVAVEEIIPQPRNPNKHSKKQIELLAKIIKAQGWRAPITVSNRSGFIVRGHARLEAAKLLGLTECPVDFQDYENEAVEWADCIADNRIAELAEPDLPLLKDLLIELDTGALDMDLTGYDAESIESLMTQLHQPEEGLTEDDAVPENVETCCKKGDLWKLGEHRLLCGDSTVITDVERLMGGEKADMVFTSPPYSDLRDYHIGDFNWDELMLGVWDCMILTAKPTAHILINLGIVYRDRAVSFYWQNWLNHAKESGYPLFGWYIWDKGFGMCGDTNGRLAPSHEFVFHFNKESAPALKWVETKTPKKMHHTFRQKDGSLKEATSPDKIGQPFKVPDSVIRITKENQNKTDHPAPFPVAFAEFGISTWAMNKDICYDPFLGSGSTLIACEKLGRKCYGMEIDPHYCSVILDRWEAYTGRKAELIES
jgi:DNA modification methylase